MSKVTVTKDQVLVVADKIKTDLTFYTNTECLSHFDESVLQDFKPDPELPTVVGLDDDLHYVVVDKDEHNLLAFEDVLPNIPVPDELLIALNAQFPKLKAGLSGDAIKMPIGKATETLGVYSLAYARLSMLESIIYILENRPTVLKAIRFMNLQHKRLFKRLNKLLD